ncbi:MAG TPA: glycosyltransferase [Nitrospirae bacterium]|nr:glycosyltransferase [Nitrospirota bacterium]
MIIYSVIVPAYNADRTISKCLSSLTNQSISQDAYEVIVVDDGSTDKTPDIIRQFQVRYLFQENSGPATARNKGAEEAKGEIILFTDSDCVPQSNWIEEMTKPFDDPEVMAVKGGYRTEQRSLTARFAQIEFEERFEMLKKSESIDMVDTYSAGFRRSVFLSLGGFDQSFPVANNEDTDFSYKMSDAGHKMVFNPDAVVLHLNHPDSIWRYARLKFWRGYWRMVVYRRYPDKMLKDSYTPQTLKLQILFLFLSLMCLSVVWLDTTVVYSLLIIALILFIATSIPFAVLALRRDITVGLLAPFFLSLRALALGSGSIWGMLFSKKVV